VLGAGLGATIKKEQSEETRYSKLKVVLSYIENHGDVGTIDAPGSYFKGTLPMAWGPLGASEGDIVYFGGSTDRTVVGLGGSMSHIIGTHKGAEQAILMGSALPDLVSVLTSTPAIGRLLGRSADPASMALLGGVTALAEMKGPKQPVEFLAKTLLHGPVPERKRPAGENAPTYVVLGTPMYVALAG